MTDIQLLLPDLLLIVCGFVLCRYTSLERSVWDAAERLVYYLLFPVLLFNSVLRTPLDPGNTAMLALGALGTVGAGIALAYLAGKLPGADPLAHASGAQTAFRFNSFIALAVGERLLGTQGVAWAALMVAFCVPVCNVAAVWPLARAGGHGYLRELARNPLIVATLSGLIANLAGLKFPEPVALTLHRIGLAALPLGLMAVGAGLRFGALREWPGLAAGFIGIRHVALPFVALALGQLLHLPAQQQVILLMFGALPTASSAYVLAARMGGRADFVAGLVTLSTLIGMVSLPLWLLLAPR